MTDRKHLQQADHFPGAPRMKTADAASYAGVSPRTLEKWRNTRSDLPFHRLGRAIVYSKDDLDQFLARNRLLNTTGRHATLIDQV